MRTNRATYFTAFAILFCAGTSLAQPAQPTASIPRLVNLTGTFRPTDGQAPAAVETVRLALYADEVGGLPVWEEMQSVSIDRDGRYSVLLGSTQPDGVPIEVFASGDARWLGMHWQRPGEAEAARFRITSVPYALRASDADTLGGKPAAAYLLAPAFSDTATHGSTTTAARGTTTTTSANPTAIINPGSTNQLVKYVNGSDVGPSALYDAGGFVGVNTTAPLDAMHVRFTNTNGALTGFAVQNLGSTSTSYSGMLFYDQNGALGQFQGFNNLTHEYRINNIATGGSINFMIGSASKFLVANTGDISVAGNLLKGSSRFVHNFGTNNMFAGLNSGNFTMTGGSNSGFGFAVLVQNSTGVANTAVGTFALGGNTTGTSNTATGYAALQSNSAGNSNTAVGTGALISTNANSNGAFGNQSLENNTTGCCNNAVGNLSLHNNTTGSSNTALGDSAGANATIGSNNIYIGANVVGVAGESNTMYLGNVATQTKAFIAGVRGITTGAANAVTVMIDSNGQLGTVNSSRRYKEDIRDMANASDGLMKLRPVTFRYTQPYADGSQPIDYGLIAEEVEEVYPDLVAHRADGDVETVQYHKINAMLLNEVQKQHRTLEEQREQIDTQRAEIQLLKARLTALESHREER